MENWEEVARGGKKREEGRDSVAGRRNESEFEQRDGSTLTTWVFPFSENLIREREVESGRRSFFALVVTARRAEKKKLQTFLPPIKMAALFLLPPF